jgi:membrane protein YdbS with pleckstrin-like domain
MTLDGPAASSAAELHRDGGGPHDERPVPPELPGDQVGNRRRLPKRTVGYWQLQRALVGLLVIGIAILGASTLTWFSPLVRWLIVAVLACYFVFVAVLVGPQIRYRLFWYAISEDEIDVQHGFLVRYRTVVPMSRVQHLRTETGPLADRFRVATLHIHTAAGAITIHGLDADEADEVRSKIGRLAGLADDV